MSRIGIKPVKIPEGVEIKIEGKLCKVKGPKGELEYQIPRVIELEQKDNSLILKRNGEDKNKRALHGLARALVANLVEGVTKGFEKKLEINGVGYKAKLEGDNLVLELGFSHPVKVKKPEGIDFKVEKNVIIVSGIDKQMVGEIASQIRNFRPPEPYKGKGIAYQGEHIRRKVGKAVGGEEGAATGAE
ncbi:50S ribosomal protein L6 [Patescibacteria group bacterium]